ncbi:MAG: glycosyltransferase family 2 protein [Kiloniellales bacterium]|nr:glycosyltransferase family 2 protein [Kiloniellales bacterium]
MSDHISDDRLAGAVHRPTVTIGMPVFNGARYLERALKGVIDQSYEDFTLIVSDNASDDGTWEILEKWAARDDRIVLYRQAFNIGPLANFRYLLDKCDSRYFMWHAYDDWIESNYLESLVKVLIENPDCKLAIPKIDKVGAEGTLLETKHPPVTRQCSRQERINLLLSNTEPAWFYGLFDAYILKERYRLAVNFGYVWGSDTMVLVSYILNDEIIGNNDALFTQRITRVSTTNYAPRSAWERTRFFTWFVFCHFRVLGASKLTFGEKVHAMPRVFRHAYPRPITAKRLLKRPLKRLIRKLRVNTNSRF